MKVFTNAVFILLLCGSIFAAAPLAIDDLHLTAADTSRICYPLVNDTDADGDLLSLESFDSVSTQGGTVTNNGNGTLTYNPPAGFAGLDTFGYTVSDGSNSDSGTVSISVNATFDISTARANILNGVNTLADPGGPSGCVAYGPTAYSIGNYGGENRSDPIVAASTLGHGRGLAMGDHQWLRMGSYGSTADTGIFYLNAIEWLTGTNSKDIKIVVCDTDSNNSNTWLASQGYTNVVRTSNYAAELPDADLLIGWLGSSISQSNVNLIRDFARNGGGLFLCDYGVGYVWWWTGTGVKNAPGNRVLRQAGIGFALEGGGSLSIDPSSGQTTSDTVIDMLENSSSYSSTNLDIGGTVMGRMFDILQEGDNLLARLDMEFYDRIDTIIPTPSTPVSNSFDKALLRRECAILQNTPVDEIVAHRTAEGVYGAIPVDAPRVSQTFNFNVTKEGIDTRGKDSGIWLSTGLYAVPGEIVTVNVSLSVRNLDLEVKINGDWNNVSDRSSYQRMPFGTSTEYALNQANVQAANPYGGLIYITIPKNTIPGAFNATISNAIEAPFFVLGLNTNAEWISTLRDKPGPYAELCSGNMIISVPKKQIIDLDKAEELMTFWHDGVAAQDDLGGWTGRRSRPMRMYSMVMTAWGSGYAGYPIGGWGWDFGDYPSKEEGNCWGAFHETGHWHQSGYWTDGRTGEVTVNVFTMYAIETVCDSGKASDGWSRMWDPSRRVGMYEACVAAGGFDGIGVGDRLGMFMQLRIAFGWDAFKNTFQTYLDDEVSNPSALPANDQEEWDQLMTRFSTVVGYDLSPFFVDWGYGVSQTAINSLSNLPKWNMLEIYPESYGLIMQGESVVINNPVSNDYSFDGVKILDSISQPEHGTLTSNGNGTYTYTSNTRFSGTEIITYTVVNGFGNSFTADIAIEVGSDAITRQVWEGISGAYVYDLTYHPDYPDNPTFTENITSFQAPTDWGDNYGSKIHGFLIPETTGKYTFWIASDDRSELWLSSDTDPANSEKIAQVAGIKPTWTDPQQWDKYSSQQSTSIKLFAGKPYYIMALHKEGNGGDHLAVAWQGPDITQQVISGQYLMPYADDYDWAPRFNSDPIIVIDAIEGISYNDTIAGIAEAFNGQAVTYFKLTGPDWLNIASDGTLSGIASDSDATGMNYYSVQAKDANNNTSNAQLHIFVHNTFTGELGLSDFAKFAENWLNTGCLDFPACQSSDLDGDNDVDEDDLLIFISYWMADF